MARVLVTTENPGWYDELKIISYYSESELEIRILQYADTAFKGYFVLPFKLTIQYNGASANPDLVFIREDYKDWKVIEVELGLHDNRHIRSQVEVFSKGMYEASKVAKYLKSKNPAIDEDKVRNLIKDNQPPEVLVIVDDPNASWIEGFREEGIKVCVFQVYKNLNGMELYRINGDYPYIFSEESHITFPYRKQFPDIIKLSAPEVIAERHDEEVSLFYMNREMKGVVIEQRASKLIKVNRLIVPPGKDLVLGKDIENRYILRLN